MTKRKDVLIAIIVGVLVGGSILYMLVNWLCLAPAAKLDGYLADAKKAIGVYNDSIAANGKSRDTLKKFVAQTLGTDQEISKVSSLTQTRLEAMVSKAGLTHVNGNSLPALDPISARALAGGVGKAVGWKISAKGKLDQVIGFLCELDAEPYLHKIEKLTLKPNGPDVQVDLEYLTLLMIEMKDTSFKPLPTMALETLQQPPTPSLDDRLASVQLISVRDVLRPYIPRPPDPPPPPPQPPTTQQAEQPPPPQPTPPQPQDPNARMKVADLSIYNGREEVGVYHTDSNRVQRLKVGEALGGGTIVMIDRRPLPRRDNPNLFSPGRVILLMGDQYFAVEVERTVAEKYQMAAEQLPQGLKKS